MNFQKQKNHLNGCLEPQGGLDGTTARSAIKSNSNYQRSQFVHVLQYTILLFLFSSSVAALRSREETTPRVTVGNPRVTIGHLGATMGHPRLTIGHLRVTIGHFRVTIGHNRITIGHYFFFYKQT